MVLFPFPSLLREAVPEVRRDFRQWTLGEGLNKGQGIQSLMGMIAHGRCKAEGGLIHWALTNEHRFKFSLKACNNLIIYNYMYNGWLPLQKETLKDCYFLIIAESSAI